MQNNDHLQFSTESDRQEVLILTAETTRFASMLKHKLQLFDNNVHLYTKPPHSFKGFHSCVFMNVTESFFKKMISSYDKRMIFIFFDQRALAQRCLTTISNNKRGNIKIIAIESSPEHYEDDIEKIFWFSFSRNKEIYLPIVHRHRKHRPHTATKIHRSIRKPFTLQSILKPKVMISAIIICIVFIHLLFIPALAVASYYHYRSARLLQQQELSRAMDYAEKGSQMIALTRSLYSLVRPTFSLFSVGIIPDNIILMNESTNNLITTTNNLAKQQNEFIDLFQKQSKTADDVAYLSALKTAIFEKVLKTNQDLQVLETKLPSWNKELKDTRIKIHRITSAIELTQRFFPYFDSIFAQNATKRYLLLFANNMELRPGGGFIGSFGIVTIQNYTIKDIKVYDVYDADGQLQAHIRPPEPIQEHLNQPHWFLRDSAFSPDFYENYEQATYFLEKTMNYEDFDGVLLITTTAVQNILRSVGDVYLPDYKETINADNFYLKTQLYAEDEFFPGSRQKQTFVSVAMNQLLQALPSADPLLLYEMIQKSFDEKQIVAYFEEPELQQQLDSMYWSGRTISPKCTSDNPNCIVDYIFPYDANLGVNKANYYVTRSQQVSSTISPTGDVLTKYTVIYKNDSFKDVFPGGRYKNYFQVLIPRSARITSVTIDDKEIKNFDVSRNQYTNVGLLAEVEPQSITKVTVSYLISQPISTGSSIYQLIVQKQIGSANSDFQLSVTLPENVYVVNKNFSPIVKDNKILYNTTLSADKIFYIEFFQE